MIMINGKLRVKSNLFVYVWDLEGNLLRQIETHNEWESAGLTALRNFVASIPPASPSHIGWVDDGGTERARDIITQRVLDGVDPIVTFRQFLPSVTTANGFDIDTVRLYNVATGGDPWAEGSFAPAISKTDAIQITVEWEHEFSDDGV